jgi:hypothetical protein
MPDFFHCMHDLVKSYSLAIAQHVRHARQELKKIEEGLSRHPGLDGQRQDAPETQPPVEVRQADVRRWEMVHSAYRQHLETLSLTLHPFSIHDSTPQTAAQVQTRLQAEVDAIETLAQGQQLPARHNAMKKVRNQLPALAALVDFWWEGVGQDLEQAALSAPWRTWARESLLPWI